MIFGVFVAAAGTGITIEGVLRFSMPAVLHRDSHSYGGPSSMGSLGRRRDVPVAADAAAASTSAISNKKI